MLRPIQGNNSFDLNFNLKNVSSIEFLFLLLWVFSSNMEEHSLLEKLNSIFVKEAGSMILLCMF